MSGWNKPDYVIRKQLRLFIFFKVFDQSVIVDEASIPWSIVFQEDLTLAAVDKSMRSGENLR